jgi:lysophospholipase L1-like esterase
MQDATMRSLSRPFVTGIDVRGTAKGLVVTIGDSITDGSQIPGASSPAGGKDVRYPDYLARRLEEFAPGWSVVNAGIGGNRLLSGGLIPALGPSLLDRLGPDVLQRQGVTDVIVLIGINDLSLGKPASASDVIAGLELAVAKLRAPRGGCPRRLNVLVGTITPSGGSTRPGAFAQVGAIRDQINEYIRSGALGAYVDFDRALRDQQDHDRLASQYDSGDHLHPSPAGNRRMAAEINLKSLRGRRCGGSASAG